MHGDERLRINTYVAQQWTESRFEMDFDEKDLHAQLCSEQLLQFARLAQSKRKVGGWRRGEGEGFARSISVPSSSVVA